MRVPWHHSATIICSYMTILFSKSIKPYPCPCSGVLGAIGTEDFVRGSHSKWNIVMTSSQIQDLAIMSHALYPLRYHAIPSFRGSHWLVCLFVLTDRAPLRMWWVVKEPIETSCHQSQSIHVIGRAWSKDGPYISNKSQIGVHAGCKGQIIALHIRRNCVWQYLNCQISYAPDLWYILKRAPSVLYQ